MNSPPCFKAKYVTSTILAPLEFPDLVQPIYEILRTVRVDYLHSLRRPQVINAIAKTISRMIVAHFFDVLWVLIVALHCANRR